MAAILMAFVFAAAGAAAENQTAPPPSRARQKEMLAAIRENAMHYVARLPDFVCTQITRRSIDRTGSGKHWHGLDVIQEELTYTGRRESYRVIAIDGEPVNIAHNQIRGYRSSGEFGTLPLRIFEPEAGTDFRWERWDVDEGRREAVFRFRVARDSSKMIVTVGKLRAIVGFHGRVHADAETCAVMRIEVEQEIPRRFPLETGIIDMRYGTIAISGREYLLPVRAELRSRYKRTIVRNEIEFSRYQKYGAEATVTFQDEVQP